MPEDIHPEGEVPVDLYIGLRLQAYRSEAQGGGNSAEATRLISCTECARRFYSDHILKKTCSHLCTMARGRRRNRNRHGKA